MKYFYYLKKESKDKDSKHHHEHHEHHSDYHSKMEPVEHHEVFGKYTRDFEDIKKVLENPPYTWSAYPRDGEGLLEIIKMEFDELWTAYKAGNYKGQVENFIHVAAACVCAHNHMTCDK